MPIVIGLESLVVSHSLPTIWLPWIVAYLIVTEVIQFCVHVTNHHNDHPIYRLAWDHEDADLFTWCVAITWLVLYCGIFAVGLQDGPSITDPLVGCLLVGQICTSWAIHRAIHSNTIFHRRTLVGDAREIRVYALGVACYAGATILVW